MPRKRKQAHGEDEPQGHHGPDGTREHGVPEWSVARRTLGCQFGLPVQNTPQYSKQSMMTMSFICSDDGLSLNLLLRSATLRVTLTGTVTCSLTVSAAPGRARRLSDGQSRSLLVTARRPASEYPEQVREGH